MFELAADSHLSLQDFDHAPDGSLSSALVNVARGAFAIIKGNSRGGQGFWVDTPFATIRGTASRYGTGVVTFAALTFAILEKIQAAPWDREPEDDVLPWQDVKHGAYEIVTKGPIPQVTPVEDVTQTIVVRPFGSSFAVETSRNSPSQMAEMLAAAQNAINTYRMGQQDPFTLQQRADLQDIQPGSRGSAGSSTLFVEASHSTSIQSISVTSFKSQAILASNDAPVAASIVVPFTDQLLPPVITGLSSARSFTVIAGNILTNDTNPTLTIAAAAGATVEIFKGGVSAGFATETAPGIFSITSLGLGDGTFIFTAIATTPLNPSGVTSAPLILTVDATAPGAPAITAITDGGMQVTGTVANGGLTNDATPTLTGTAEPNSTVIDLRRRDTARHRNG